MDSKFLQERICTRRTTTGASPGPGRKAFLPLPRPADTRMGSSAAERRARPILSPFFRVEVTICCLLLLEAFLVVPVYIVCLVLVVDSYVMRRKRLGKRCCAVRRGCALPPHSLCGSRSSSISLFLLHTRTSKRTPPTRFP